MTAAEMIKQRRDEWAELENKLFTYSRNRRRKASAEELSRFAEMFRNVCADLARARAQGYPEDLIDYLNALAARSHNIFYAAAPVRAGAPWRFLTAIFPLTVRRNAVYVGAALFLFFGPMAGIVAISDSDALYQLVPKRMLEAYERMYEKGHAEGRGEDTDMAMTGFYVRNNVGIAFQCFATGIFFGIGSLFFLIFNGVVIGAVVGFISQGPSAMNLLSFISGHGPFELFAICLSGAAGLRLGFGALITGSRSRAESLRVAAFEAVKLVIGAAILLLGAALIEGFFSPSSLPMVVKFLFGAFCALFLIWYLVIYSGTVSRRVAAAEAELEQSA